ncbi:siderophore-interacting protein [Catenulispora rubra]|uniref:siderophore-interacting protein n=1 Tax=Catenulispora rubra TaxID=280293 RepID=UPI0018926670|nr:siderophore-interacting protein [Catenulispora rubra]
MYVPHDDLVRGFAEACRTGDTVALRDTLSGDAKAVTDSGGLLPATLGVIHGARDVARLAAVLLCGSGDTELSIEAVNGRAGLALRRGGRALAVVGIDAAGAEITALWIVLNPDKLCGWHH